MNDFVSDFQSRYEAPSDADVQRLIAQAHRMRNQAMRDALVGFWGMLRRNIAVKRAAPVERHA